MEFRIWLEAKEAFVKNIIDAIFKSTQFIVGGEWSLKKDTSLGASIKTQFTQYGHMEGRGIIQPRDYFVVYTWARVFKKPKSDMDIKNLYYKSMAGDYSLPKWVKDKGQWVKADKYDVLSGHELLEINLSIVGTKGFVNSMSPLDSRGEMERIADTEKEGKFLRTPYEAANYIKTSIDSFYRKWDNNDDDGDDENPYFDPTPAGSRDLVGV